MPPSARITWPVTNEESSEAKNSATFAISFGSAALFNAEEFMSFSLASGDICSNISVFVTLGAIALTLIFDDHNSVAILFVALAKADLLEP